MYIREDRTLVFIASALPTNLLKCYSTSCYGKTLRTAINKLKDKTLGVMDFGASITITGSLLSIGS
jgi:hypothetical protein